MKKILSGNKGFSLIELIVVIAILGVLVGVAAPNLMGYVDKANAAKDTANIETVKRAAEAYYAENNTDTDITDTDLEDVFPEGFPDLKSKANDGKVIKVTVSETGVITAAPAGGSE